MDIEGILPSYYRYNLDTSLREPVQTPQTKQDYVFIDMVMGMKPPPSAIRAPQDVGETKHSLVDERPLDIKDENTVGVRSVDEMSRATAAEHARRYRSFSRLSLLESRRNMEKIVRMIKRMRGECPFLGDNLEGGRACTKVFIRCGDRSQFSLRETAAQQVKPHTCNYLPAAIKSGVLIVDADPRVREFCKQSLSLFLGQVAGDIVTTDSPSEALELVNRSKVSGRPFGLFIIDTSLPENGGYWLVNELFGRNHNVGIILTSDERGRIRPPKDFTGDVELAPQERFAGTILRKPFHSDELLAALKKVNFRK
jgi:CheY-like chemotaxis protein